MSDPRKASLTFDGDGSEVFGLALWTGALTVLTLGLYRFWAKTRLRAYFWSRSRLDGMGFEFTGTGLEMFRGFLVALVILAFYMAIVQVVFYFIGMRFVLNPRNQAEILAQLLLVYSSFLALVPLMIFARYRSLRYKLVRTRFRGIRWGMDSAAWSYTWRAILYLLATICTLGLLHPLMRFRLEKFMADRISFGDARLVQGGRWTELYGAMKHLFIGLVLVVSGGVLSVLGSPGLGLLLALPGSVWAAIGLLSYYVQGFAVLTRGKRLELAGGAGVVTFESAPRTASIIGYYITGSLVVGFAASAVGGLGVMMLAGAEESLGQMPEEVVLGLGLAAYVGFLTFLAAVNLAVTTRRVIGHFISTVAVLNVDALAQVRQRAGEEGGDAEGFADALDVGGAF